MSREGWLAFGFGGAAALGVMALPFLRFVLSAFTTLVHEMGHAAAGWLFGYPSVPAFDFVYGGGVTLQQDRVWVLVAAVVAAGVYALHRVRAEPALRSLVGASLTLYGIAALTRAHEAVIVAMGHGGELAFATLAFHRALSGRGIAVAAERPLYGFLGWFLVLSDLGFAWGLLTSPLQRAAYEEAKGGGHWMDFSRLGDEFLGLPLEAVAAGFLVLCLLPPLLAVRLQRRVEED